MSRSPDRRAGRRGRPLRGPGVAAGLIIATAVLLRVSGIMEWLFYYPTPGETQPPPEMAGVESVWFESGDGTRLHGWFIPAVGIPTAAAPSVLHVHGNAGNIEDHIGFTEYLPGTGFNLLIFDYRGYGRSEGRARRRNALIADAHAALDALLRHDDVDAGRVGLYGQSLGGGIALQLMAERPEIRAAVIESAFTGWRDIAASAVGGDPPSWLGRLLARVLIADHARPIDAIARIDRPMLLLHGTADSIIPVSHGRRLAAASSHATLVELPGGDHNTLRQTHPRIDRLVVEFLGEHLSLEHADRADTLAETP